MEGSSSAHYVCAGECGGVSENPGTCQVENCSHKGTELTECGCGDVESHKTSSENV